MEDTRLALIADDFTGALDTGVQFLSGSVWPVVLYGDTATPSADLSHSGGTTFVVLDTESRFLEATEAGQAVGAACRKLQSAGFVPFFKKIDSTLRGNVGAEIDAMMEKCGFEAAAIVPSVPKNGRTVDGGICLAHGVPVAETESGRDPFTPSAGSNVADVLAAQSTRRATGIDLSAVRSGSQEVADEVRRRIEDRAELLVFDAATDGDLAQIADALGMLSRRVLLVGTSGFAEAVAARTPWAMVERRTNAGPGRAIFVVGSLMETTKRQAERLAAHKDSVGRVEIDTKRTLETPEDERMRVAAAGKAVLASGQHLLVTPTPGSAPAGTEGQTMPDKRAARRVARFMGSCTRSIVRSSQVETVVLSGGSTALAVVRALEVEALELLGEVQDGLVLSCGVSPLRRRPYKFLTKAGGFGTQNAFERILWELDSRRKQT